MLAPPGGGHTVEKQPMQGKEVSGEQQASWSPSSTGHRSILEVQVGSAFPCPWKCSQRHCALFFFAKHSIPLELLIQSGRWARRQYHPHVTDDKD